MVTKRAGPESACWANSPPVSKVRESQEAVAWFDARTRDRRGSLPFAEETVDLTCGILTDPAEAEHFADVVSLLPLLALYHGDDCPEDDQVRAVQITGQDIGECAEMLDIGK